jgi:3-isopropylmalate dehydratase small subunit
MEPFRSVTGAAAPLLIDDINTDQIIPSAWLRRMDADLAEGLFAYLRRRPDGSSNADFVLERPQFRQARILVTGSNFGCGSSREHAAWAMAAFGIRAVIARSHADIFRENCLKNGILAISLPPEHMDEFTARVQAVDGREPFTVDLEAEEIRGPGGYARAFEIAPHERTALLEGLDDIGLTLKYGEAISEWERRTSNERPFLQALSIRR